MKLFNYKNFNQTAFSKYAESLPDIKKNELIKSSVLKQNAEIRKAFHSQGNSGYAVVPMYGKIEGEALNYDGKTDIIPNTTKTFERGVVVIGRANAWIEDDFTEDITGNEGFMSSVAQQVKGYFDEVDQNTILAILKGIFSMTGAKNLEFINTHTHSILEEINPEIDVTTLNTAIQKACGDSKTKFSVVVMHSVVATNLENLNLLNYLKYTDINGVQRELGLGTLNGKTVIIDDSMPVEKTTDGTANVYTTYVLGKGAIDFEDIGAKVPYEINRDPKTNGGQDTLYARTRKCFAPFGISYLKKNQASPSPLESELADGANWTLVKDTLTQSIIEHKYIPIARIMSKG